LKLTLTAVGSIAQAEMQRLIARPSRITSRALITVT
jgi:hypothetical protein